MWLEYLWGYFEGFLQLLWQELLCMQSLQSTLKGTSTCSSPAVASGVARAFPGGRAAHPENQNEEENEENLR